MAEPTNGQPSDSSTERGSPVNVNTTGNVTVTRKDVATGDVKELHTDLLKQLVDCCDEQTRVLQDIITDTKKEISNVVKEAKKQTKLMDDIGRGKGGMGGSSSGGGGSGGGSGSGSGSGGGSSTTDWQKALLQMGKDIQSLLTKDVGGDGGGGGLGYASARGAQKAFKAEIDAATDTIESGLPAFNKFFDLFDQGVTAQFEQNMLGVNKKLVDFGRSLMDIQGAAQKTMGVIDEMFKAGQGGMIDVTALYEDLGAGLLKNRDALASTLPVVKEFADKQKLLIGTLGTNLEEVARSFKENREAAKAAFGDDFLERIPFDELNAIQTTMLEQQRRAGVKATNTEILTSQNARSQMQLLKDISFATGKTVEEVIKLQEEEGMTLEELRFNGLITKEQVDILRSQQTTFDAMGIKALSDMMLDIAGSGGMTGYKRKEGVPLMLGQGNNEAIISEIYKIGMSAAGKTNEGKQQMIDLTAQLKGLEGNGTFAASVLREQSEAVKTLAALEVHGTRITGSQAEIRRNGGDASIAGISAQQQGTDGGAGGIAQGWFNSFQEIIKNNLGGGGDLAIALGLNTAAVIANTFAHAGGAAGGLVSRLLKGGGGLLKKIPGAGKLLAMMGMGGGATAAAMNPATMNAAANASKYTNGFNPGLVPMEETAKKAAGKSTAKMASKAGAKSLLKKIPIIGLLAGLGFGISRLMDGDFVGAGLEVASGAASTVPGLGTAASVGIDAGLLARDINMAGGVAGSPTSDQKGIAPTAGDKATVAPAGVKTSSAGAAPSPNALYTQLVMQTSHLAMMVNLLHQGNQTRLDMLSNIGQSTGTQTGTISRPKTRYGRNTPTNAFSPLLAGVNE